MSKAAADLLKAALRLGERERSELVDRIQDSLGPPDVTGINSMNEEELLAELNRRYEEARRDPSVLIPWEEVRRGL